MSLELPPPPFFLALVYEKEVAVTNRAEHEEMVKLPKWPSELRLPNFDGASFVSPFHNPSSVRLDR